jgi:tetratricopeptide (TPR) repeat protein
VLQSAAVTEEKEGYGNDRRERPLSKGEATAPHLVVRLGDQLMGKAPLGDELRIGRGRDNDLVLPDTRSGRYHARIYRQGDHFFLCNAGSSNDTWVNGISLIGHRRLRPGDRILLGDAELIFQAGTDIEGAPRSAPGAAVADPGGKARRRLAYTLTPAGVVLLLALAIVGAYFLIPALFQPKAPTAESTATAETAAAIEPPPTSLPVPTPSRSPRPSPVPSSTPPPTADLDAQLAQADVLVLKSRFEEAIDIYQEVARQEPDNVRAEIGWAWALLLDGLPDQALLHARRASELAPRSAEASTILARAYVEMKEADRALSWGQRAVRSEPSSGEAQAVLALALLLDGRSQEAVAQVKAGLEAAPRSAEAHRVRGLLYQAVEDDPQMAAVELRAAADLQPELWLRHHELGLALLQAGDHEAAVVALTNALVLRHKAVTYTALGQAHYQMGQYDQAKSFLEQSLSAGAWDADTYALLAALNAQQGRCDDARVYYGQALQQNPDHPLARQAQATCGKAVSGPTAAATGAAAGAATATATLSVAESSATPLSGHIAFPVWNRDQGYYDTYLARIDGSDRQLVVEQMHQPALRADGQWLAVNGERPEHMNLCLVRPDGSGLLEISDYVEDSHPAWSPDGRSLALDSTRHPDRQSRAYVIDEVPYDGTRAEGRVLRSDLYEALGQRPIWTSDGRIVYSGCDHTLAPPHCGLFLISAEPGPQTPEPLTDHASDTAPAISGQRVAFMSNRDGNWEIYILEMGVPGQQRLTHNTANDGLPVWSPDGRTLAFVSDQGGVWAVWAMEADGSQRRKLFDLGGGGLAFDWQEESISWGP